MADTEVGMNTDLREVQNSNARIPILVTVVGIKTVVMNELLKRPEKAASGMYATSLGMVTTLLPLQETLPMQGK
jgi:hypothetical protein